MEDRILSFELLSCISAYYPIGLPQERNKYAGFGSLEKIVEKKINTLIAGKPIEPWAGLVEKINAAFPEALTTDTSSSPQPSLSLLIETHRDTSHVLVRQSRIRLAISLLGEYYTIGMEETLSSPSGMYNGTGPVVREEYSAEEEKMIQQIREAVAEYYPAYRALDYGFLCTKKLYGGIPVTEDMNGRIHAFPLFLFLF